VHVCECIRAGEGERETRSENHKENNGMFEGSAGF